MSDPRGTSCSPTASTPAAITATSLIPSTWVWARNPRATRDRHLRPANLAARRRQRPSVSQASAASGNPSIAQALKPFPQYGSISDAYGFVGNTRYHALQVYVDQARLTHGLTFMIELHVVAVDRQQRHLPRGVRHPGVCGDGRQVPPGPLAGSQPFARRSAAQVRGDGSVQPAIRHWQPWRWKPIRRACVFGGFRLSTIFSAYSGAPLSIMMNTCNTNPSRRTSATR